MNGLVDAPIFHHVSFLLKPSEYGVGDGPDRSVGGDLTSCELSSFTDPQTEVWVVILHLRLLFSRPSDCRVGGGSVLCHIVSPRHGHGRE